MFDMFVPYADEDQVRSYPQLIAPVNKYVETRERLIIKMLNEAQIVNSAHPLVRLVTMFLIPDDYEETLDGFYDRKINEWCSALGFYTSINKGKTFNDLFYPGPNMIVLDTSFSFTGPENLISPDYESPLRFWRIPSTVHPMMMPLGDKVDVEPDITVASINVRRLMDLFKYWSEQQLAIDPSYRYSVSEFVAQVVLPVSLRSVGDAVAINMGVQYYTTGTIVINEYKGAYSGWFDIERLIPRYTEALDELAVTDDKIRNLFGYYPMLRYENISRWLPVGMGAVTTANSLPMFAMSMPLIYLLENLVRNPATVSDWRAIKTRMKRFFNSHRPTPEAYTRVIYDSVMEDMAGL